jgi:hypothetical protein
MDWNMFHNIDLEKEIETQFTLRHREIDLPVKVLVQIHTGLLLESSPHLPPLKQ